MYSVLLASSEGAAGAPMSPFEVNTGLIFWTWLVFIALYFLLKKYAWPAILTVTVQREETIRRQLEEAEQAHAKAAALLAEQQKLLGESRTQAQSILAEAKSASDRERAAAVLKTREEQDQLLARARREIAAEGEKARQELRREAVDLSLAAASKLIGERLSSDADKKIVLDYLSTLESSH
ncbi:MAG: F0F1 ATP synthase subunit B [Gemmatimonadales bacterium]|jgi:F-type H+-transporting ATPase subunit b|nr:MAG: F0F1 ATP synthase subunit B [Gemmatimonadales bacterium]